MIIVSMKRISYPGVHLFELKYGQMTFRTRPSESKLIAYISAVRSANLFLRMFWKRQFMRKLWSGQ
jgi:hypothetical protein